MQLQNVFKLVRSASSALTTCPYADRPCLLLPEHLLGGKQGRPGALGELTVQVNRARRPPRDKKAGPSPAGECTVVTDLHQVCDRPFDHLNKTHVTLTQMLMCNLTHCLPLAPTPGRPPCGVGLQAVGVASVPS